MAKVLRSIRLSPEADEVLRVMACRQERSVSQLIEMAVREKFLRPDHDPRPDVVAKAPRQLARQAAKPKGPPKPTIQRGSPSPSLERFMTE